MVHSQYPRPKTTKGEVLINSPKQINAQNRLNFLLSYLVLMELSADLSRLDDIVQYKVVYKNYHEHNCHTYDQNIGPMVPILHTISKDDTVSS